MSFEKKIRWISASVSPRQLTELKYRFKHDINSKRKYSQIKDFSDLVGVLIIRGIVDADKVSLLNEICQDYFSINFSEIPDLLPNGNCNNVQKSSSWQSLLNEAANPTDVTNAISNQRSYSADTSTSSISPNIIDCIANNIEERQWRPFTRALKVKTNEIASEVSIPDKVRKAFVTFLQNTEPSRQWPLVEVALEQIHRLDIRDQCRLIIAS